MNRKKNPGRKRREPRVVTISPQAALFDFDEYYVAHAKIGGGLRYRLDRTGHGQYLVVRETSGVISGARVRHSVQEGRLTAPNRDEAIGKFMAMLLRQRLPVRAFVMVGIPKRQLQ